MIVTVIYWLGYAAIVAGVGLMLGLPGALIAGGVCVINHAHWKAS